MKQLCLLVGCRLAAVDCMQLLLSLDYGTPCTPPLIVVVGHYAQSAEVGVAWHLPVGGTPPRDYRDDRRSNKLS